MRAILATENGATAGEVADALEVEGIHVEIAFTEVPDHPSAVARAFEDADGKLGAEQADVLVAVGSGAGVVAAVVTAVKSGVPVLAYRSGSEPASRHARAIARLATGVIDGDASELAREIRAQGT